MFLNDFLTHYYNKAALYTLIHCAKQGSVIKMLKVISVFRVSATVVLLVPNCRVSLLCKKKKLV